MRSSADNGPRIKNSDYEKWSITKSDNPLDIASKFVWSYIGKNYSKAFKISSGFWPGTIQCIYAMGFIFKQLIHVRMEKPTLQNKPSHIEEDGWSMN